MKLLISTLLVMVLVSSAYADKQALKESIDVVNSVIGVCQSEGMIACEKNFKGMDDFFKYVYLFDEVAQFDQAFQNFVAQKYGNESEGDSYVLRASLNLTLDITFKPEQFAAKMQDAEKTADGYLVTMTSGDRMEIKRAGEEWVLSIPAYGPEQLKPLEPYYLANQLKRSILIYRSMEADLAGLGKKELLDNVGQDMAPLLLAVFGKEKYPQIEGYLSRDLQSVLDFYRQFSSREEMAAHIARVHNLKIQGQE